MLPFQRKAKKINVELFRLLFGEDANDRNRGRQMHSFS